MNNATHLDALRNVLDFVNADYAPKDVQESVELLESYLQTFEGQPNEMNDDYSRGINQQ